MSELIIKEMPPQEGDDRITWDIFQMPSLKWLASFDSEQAAREYAEWLNQREKQG